MFLLHALKTTHRRCAFSRQNGSLLATASRSGLTSCAGVPKAGERRHSSRAACAPQAASPRLKRHSALGRRHWDPEKTEDEQACHHHRPFRLSA